MEQAWCVSWCIEGPTGGVNDAEETDNNKGLHHHFQKSPLVLVQTAQYMMSEK